MIHLKLHFVGFPGLKAAAPDAFDFGSPPALIDGGVPAPPMGGGLTRGGSRLGRSRSSCG